MDHEDKKASEATARVFSGGLNKKQVIDYYNNWEDYETHLQPGRYNGPLYAAEAADRSFPSNKDTVQILDVAAGTGEVAEELVKKGFKQLDALDPSENMLRKARAKNIYQKIYCEFLSKEPSPNITNDAYSCVVISGGFGSGHIPPGALVELIRITKPGGGPPPKALSAIAEAVSSVVGENNTCLTGIGGGADTTLIQLGLLGEEPLGIHVIEGPSDTVSCFATPPPPPMPSTSTSRLVSRTSSTSGSTDLKRKIDELTVRKLELEVEYYALKIKKAKGEE